MTYPPGLYIGNFRDSFNVNYRFFNLIYDRRVYSIQYTNEYLFPGLPNNNEYRRGYYQSYNRVGQWVAQPYAKSAEQYREAGPSVYTRMVSVSYEGGAPDFLAYLDSENRYCLIAEKTDYGSGGHRV